MRRLMYVAALTAGLCLAGSSVAQPRPGGPDRGRGDGPDVRKLEAELERLAAQVKELEAKLARAERAGKDGPTGDRNEAGPRRGFGGNDRGPGGPPMSRFRDGERPAPAFGGGFRGFGPDGPRGPARAGSDGPRGPGGDRAPMPREVGGPARGPGAGGPPDVGRRIDRIIGELEQLKKDLSGPRR